MRWTVRFHRIVLFDAQGTQLVHEIDTLCLAVEPSVMYLESKAYLQRRQAVQASCISTLVPAQRKL